MNFITLSLVDAQYFFIFNDRGGYPFVMEIDGAGASFSGRQLFYCHFGRKLPAFPLMILTPIWN